MFRCVFHVLIIYMVPFWIQTFCHATYDHSTNNVGFKNLEDDLPFGNNPLPADHNPILTNVPSKNLDSAWPQLDNNRQNLYHFLSRLNAGTNENVEPWDTDEDYDEFGIYGFLENPSKPSPLTQKEEIRLSPEFTKNKRGNQEHRSNLCHSYSTFVKPMLRSMQSSPHIKYFPEDFEAVKCASNHENVIINGHEFQCEEIKRKQYFILEHNLKEAIGFVDVSVACELRLAI